MTDIGTAVSLIVAISDLKVVQSIRRAVHANLIAAGGIDGPLGTVQMPHGRVPLPERKPGTQFHDHQSLPLSSAPVARPVVRTETIVEHVQAVPAVDTIDVMDCEPHTLAREGPLVPPWHMPVVPDTSSARIVIKCPPPPPDVMNKGSLLDFFM